MKSIKTLVIINASWGCCLTFPGSRHYSFPSFVIEMLMMYNKISAFWDWLDIDIIFNSLVVFSYKYWLNLWDSFCFKQNSGDELSYKFWLNLWGSFCFALIYTSIVVCTCPICADIYSTWSDNQMKGSSLSPKHYNRKRCPMCYFLKY